MTTQLALWPDRILVVALGDLRFDTQNPRLPADLDRSDAGIIRWMLEDTRLLDLMGSIASQGYFPGEPLLVVPEEAGSTEPPFIVVEGNRRLAAVRLLADPDLATIRGVSVRTIASEAAYRPNTLPCLVYERRELILDYLGYRHVTGIQQWRERIPYRSGSCTRIVSILGGMTG